MYSKFKSRSLYFPGGRAHVVSRNIRELQDLTKIHIYTFITMHCVQSLVFIQNEIKNQASFEEEQSAEIGD